LSKPRLTTITTVMVGIFAAALVFLFLGGYSAAKIVRDRSVEKIAAEEAQRNARLAFQTMYMVMRKGWNRPEMEETVANLRQTLPDMRLDVVRSAGMAAVYGEAQASREHRADPAVARVFRSGKEAMARDGDMVRFLFPLEARQECLACHAHARLGEVNGVIDIHLPVQRLRAPLDLTIDSTLLIFGAVILLLLFLVFFSLRLLVVRPVARLSQHIESILASRDLSRLLPVGKYSPLEVKQLSRNFNQLVGQVNESQLQLEELAVTDPLTMLYNRRHFEAALFQEIERCKRYGGGFSVVLLDLDRFKPINDALGHAAGDAVLRQVGAVMAAHLRKNDLPARIGGDEFVALLPATDRRGAQLLVNKLRGLLAHAPALWEEKTIEIGFSAGTAVYPEDGEVPETLIRAADLRMYEDKQARHGAMRAA
jgi:diguanylate cyclase (GGDEF)-like protein